MKACFGLLLFLALGNFCFISAALIEPDTSTVEKQIELCLAKAAPQVDQVRDGLSQFAAAEDLSEARQHLAFANECAATLIFKDLTFITRLISLRGWFRELMLSPGSRGESLWSERRRDWPVLLPGSSVEGEALLWGIETTWFVDAEDEAVCLVRDREYLEQLQAKLQKLSGSSEAERASYLYKAALLAFVIALSLAISAVLALRKPKQAPTTFYLD